MVLAQSLKILLQVCGVLVAMHMHQSCRFVQPAPGLLVSTFILRIQVNDKRNRIHTVDGKNPAPIRVPEKFLKL